MTPSTFTAREVASAPQAFDLMGWIDRNPDKLEPPIGGKTLIRLDDLMLTVVGGPNARNDYHVNPTEELFFQIKGTINLRIQHHGQPHDIELPPGHLYALGAGVPHSPSRGPGTVGIVVELIRKRGVTDLHRWYCDRCNALLFEKSAYIEVVERDMPPVFEAYYGNSDNQCCKDCGYRNPGRPGPEGAGT